MARDPGDKQRRLMEAGIAEFAEHGMAGARIDRIAARAECSAGLVYTYFGSKAGLFDAIMDQVVAVTVSTTPIDVDDLGEYAGKLYDGYRQYPEIARMIAWYRLETTRTEPHPATVVAVREKIAALEDAQRRGLITSRYDARQLLLLVQGMAALWLSQPDDVTGELAGADDHARRRDTVVQAVRQLVAV
jgi:AcrR family transcriptional regulator